MDRIIGGYFRSLGALRVTQSNQVSRLRVCKGCQIPKFEIYFPHLPTIKPSTPPIALKIRIGANALVMIASGRLRRIPRTKPVAQLGMEVLAAPITKRDLQPALKGRTKIVRRDASISSIETFEARRTEHVQHLILDAPLSNSGAIRLQQLACYLVPLCDRIIQRRHALVIPRIDICSGSN